MAIDSFKINKSLSLNPQSTTISTPNDGDLYYHENKGFSSYKDGKWHDLTDIIDFSASLSMTSINLDDDTVRNNIIKMTGVLASTADVHGLSASAKGKLVYIYNQTNQTVVIKHQSFTETTPSNRIVSPTGRDLKLKPNQATLMTYDTTTSRWIVLSVGGGSGEVEIPFILGENINEGTPVYVSQGGADGGRNAGEIYTLDNTNDNRMEYIGVLAESGTAGQEKIVRLIGLVENLSGLTPGLPVYWDGGVYTQVEPSTPNTWQITVGKAVTNTSMLINPDLASSAVFIEPTAGAVTINNNQVSPFPVALMSVDGSQYKSFSAEYWVHRQSDSSASLNIAPPEFIQASGGGKFNGTPYVSKEDINGKILVGGAFTAYDGVLGRNNLIRLNSDGTQDTAFCTNAVDGSKFNNIVYSVCEQADGKILVGGIFVDYAGTSGRSNLIRLNSDGTLDTTFCAIAVDGKFSGGVSSVVEQADGKILVGGFFINHDGVSGRDYLIRLNSDGTLDTAFCANAVDGSKIGSVVYSVVEQPGGNILVGGNFIDYDGVSGRDYLIRLNSDGTLDTAFCANAVDGSKFNSNVLSIYEQVDGKILVGGDFGGYAGGGGRNNLIRLNSDGTLDTAFCVNAVDGFKLSGPVQSITETNGNKIIIAGAFTAYAGTTGRNFLIRLNPDGTLDTAFCADAVDGGKFNSVVTYVSFTPSGRILISGFFTSYNSVSGLNWFAIFTESAAVMAVVEAGNIRGVYNPVIPDWQIATGGIAGAAGIQFQIDSTGQVTYTTDNMAGANYFGEMKFEFISLIEV